MLFMNAISKILATALSRTQLLSLATSLLSELINTSTIGLSTRQSNEFLSSATNAKKTFEMQFVDFLEVFELLDTETKQCIINSLKNN